MGSYGEHMKRNSFLYILGILIVAMLSCYWGVYFANIVTKDIDHDLTRLLLATAIGLLVGLFIGLVFKLAWEQFSKLRRPLASCLPDR